MKKKFIRNNLFNLMLLIIASGFYISKCEAMTTAVSAVTTYDTSGLTALAEIVNNTTYNVTTNQGATNGGDALYNKLKDFYANRNKFTATTDKAQLITLMTSAKSAACLTAIEKISITLFEDILIFERDYAGKYSSGSSVTVAAINAMTIIAGKAIYNTNDLNPNSGVTGGCTGREITYKLQTFFNIRNSVSPTIYKDYLNAVNSMLTAAKYTPTSSRGKQYLTGNQSNTGETLWLNNSISTLATEISQVSVRSGFLEALAAASTPSALNTLINNTTYNSVTYLIDFPTTTNSVYTKIQSFFTSGVPNVTGTALTDLQTLLKNTNLAKFLTTAQQTTATTLLTAVNTMITFNTLKSELTAALTASTTPALLNTNVITIAKFNVTTLQGTNGGTAIRDK
ncbi:MAG: hypothetical protein V1646_01975, partial [bacterium]